MEKCDMSDVPTVYTHHTQTGEVQERVERKQYDRLRAALERIANMSSPLYGNHAAFIARAALAGGAAEPFA